ncbi:MAG: hypothetical protein BWY21_01926 [Parcubacteria group bacterium ADurb.Bin216]|jgi:hypothetical protein|nr:MAG: hypothetical protein BWY21_01926 [Parcubacteria group bacterium ADurb.Bin216]
MLSFQIVKSKFPIFDHFTQFIFEPVVVISGRLKSISTVIKAALLKSFPIINVPRTDVVTSIGSADLLTLSQEPKIDTVTSILETLIRLLRAGLIAAGGKTVLFPLCHTVTTIGSASISNPLYSLGGLTI